MAMNGAAVDDDDDDDDDGVPNVLTQTDGAQPILTPLSSK